MGAFWWGDTASSLWANFDGQHPSGGAEKGPALGRTTPVGSYPPNPFGLYDMHGNVWEWCADLYAPYEKRSIRDPFNNTIGIARVLRGGSWANGPWFCRAAYRNRYAPDRRSYHVGFRVCLCLD
jgi:formylglycine-generating enzyme required for sulfatase activity